MNVPAGKKVELGKGSDFNANVEEMIGAENGKANQVNPKLTGRKLAEFNHIPGGLLGN